MKDKCYYKYTSKWGEMVLEINSAGALKGLWFVGQKHFPKSIVLEVEKMPFIDQTHRLLLNELRAYERGELNRFTINLEPEGTAFQKEVWRLLRQIPYGETTTYGEIGRELAKSRGRLSMSSQAVGQAIGRNPISIIIPCHRVIGKDGSLTGYAGGIDRKTSLLALEQAHKATIKL